MIEKEMERWIVSKRSHMFVRSLKQLEPPIHGSYIMVLIGNKSWSTMYSTFFFLREREKAAQHGSARQLSRRPVHECPGLAITRTYVEYTTSTAVLGDNIF